MPFNLKEAKEIQKYLRRLEKDASQWPRLRWIVIIASVLLIGAAIYIYCGLNSLQEITSSVFSVRGNEVNAKEVELFIEGRLMNLQLEALFLFKSLLYGILGASGIAYSLINWNRHTKSGLMAKLIRKMVSEEKLIPEEISNNKLKGDAAKDRRAP